MKTDDIIAYIKAQQAPHKMGSDAYNALRDVEEWIKGHQETDQKRVDRIMKDMSKQPIVWVANDNKQRLEELAIEMQKEVEGSKKWIWLLAQTDLLVKNCLDHFNNEETNARSIKGADVLVFQAELVHNLMLKGYSDQLKSLENPEEFAKEYLTDFYGESPRNQDLSDEFIDVAKYIIERHDAFLKCIPSKTEVEYPDPPDRVHIAKRQE